MTQLYYLAITYFLASGVPVPTVYDQALHQNGKPVTEMIDCLEIRDSKYRKFYQDIGEAEGCLFTGIRVECVTK